MINGQRVLGIVVARGGSKGIPRKNLYPLGGKPMIAWTIEEAKKSTTIDRLILSSEDDEIITVAKAWGCEVPFVRPTDLARDETLGIDPVLHAIDTVPGYDWVILLQPTSPLRIAKDIDDCLNESLIKKAPCCVSISEVSESPYWMFQVSEDGHLNPVLKRTSLRRQDLPQTYVVNGAVYAANISWIQKTRTFLTEETCGYIMPKARSLDIDTMEDLWLAKQYLEVNAK